MLVLFIRPLIVLETVPLVAQFLGFELLVLSIGTTLTYIIFSS